MHLIRSIKPVFVHCGARHSSSPPTPPPLTPLHIPSPHPTPLPFVWLCHSSSFSVPDQQPGPANFLHSPSVLGIAVPCPCRVESSTPHTTRSLVLNAPSSITASAHYHQTSHHHVIFSPHPGTSVLSSIPPSLPSLSPFPPSLPPRPSSRYRSIHSPPEC